MQKLSANHTTIMKNQINDPRNLNQQHELNFVILFNKKRFDFYSQFFLFLRNS